MAQNLHRLIIETEHFQAPWLSYILEEFQRIEGAEFDCIPQLPGTAEEHPSLSYALDSGDIHCCVSEAMVYGPNISYIENGLFILNHTDSLKGDSVIKFDLFWNAFVFLSRQEELITEMNGNTIQSYSSKHPRIEHSTWDIPIVNLYFKALKKLISDRHPHLPFKLEQEAILELSHDLDYINKTMPLRLKQSAFNLFNAVTKVSPSKLIKSSQFLLMPTNYWCFDYWMEFEKSVNMRSTFYVYAESGKQSTQQWLLDPSYKVASNIRLQEQLKMMLKEGFEVGLHGSFLSSNNRDRLRNEQSILQDAIQQPVRKTRQHWLRYEEAITPYIHEELFDQDSTVGWNDRVGFRAGIASKYRPFNHRDQKPFNYFIVPQVIMDSNIYDYSFGNEEAMILKSKRLLEEVKDLKNTHISISWHPRTCSNDYKWNGAYETLVKSW